MEWVLSIRHEALTPFFQSLTFLGNPAFLLLILPIGYWSFGRRVFFPAILLVCATALINATLKEIFQVPRPDVPHLENVSGLSFPSGHAQVAAVLWTWVALELRRVWAVIAAGGLIVGIAVSRVYLGVHYPADVVAGVALGLATVALARWWLARPHEAWRRLAPHGQAVAVLGLVMVWYAVMPGGLRGKSLLAGGLLVGFWIGEIYQRRHVGFVATAGFWRSVTAVAMGLAGAFGLRIGLRTGLGALPFDAAVAIFLLYAAMGAWWSYGAPWSFCRLGLATRSTATESGTVERKTQLLEKSEYGVS